MHKLNQKIKLGLWNISPENSLGEWRWSILQVSSPGRLAGTGHWTHNKYLPADSPLQPYRHSTWPSRVGAESTSNSVWLGENGQSTWYKRPEYHNIVYMLMTPGFKNYISSILLINLI